MGTFAQPDCSQRCLVFSAPPNAHPDVSQPVIADGRDVFTTTGRSGMPIRHKQRRGMPPTARASTTAPSTKENEECAYNPA